MEQLLYIVIGFVVHIILFLITAGLYALGIYMIEGKNDEDKKIVYLDFIITIFIILIEILAWYINITVAGTMTSLLILRYVKVEKRKRVEN